MLNLLLAVIYLAFISLGLPDALLGAAWPTMYKEFDVPVSYAGVITMIIAAGTIISSLFSDRITKKFGAGKVTAVSVAITAAAMLGFSVSTSIVPLFLIALPYGLGAGSVDAALNNYVALNYESRHMSWLHCMWAVGATTGPYIMGIALTGGMHWNGAYLIIGSIQVVLSAIIFLSLPLWKKANGSSQSHAAQEKPVPLKEVVKIKGAKEVMLCFFCYCALEQTVMVWTSTYLNLWRDISAENAASFAGMFFIGITVGRAISGFVTMKLNDTQMIRLGEVIIALGLVMVLIPIEILCLAGFVMIGLGCAPVYPSIIHSTPEHFGADKSQAVIGIQMASAYVGTLLMPPVFGFIANHTTPGVFPFYLTTILVIMFIMHERLVKKTKKV